MCGRLDSYILSFSHLQTTKDKARWAGVSHYRSPEKPVFLLAVLNHIAHGEILRNFISPTPELQETYELCFTKIYPDHDPPNMAIPFSELAKANFWEILPKAQARSKKHLSFTTIEQLKEDCFGAKFSEDLYLLLQMEHSRKKLGTALINPYFSTEIRNSLAIYLQ